MRDATGYGVYPIRLPDVPVSQGVIPFSKGPLGLQVCEFIENYENHLDRTLVREMQWVRRWVLEDKGLFATLIPECPTKGDYARLPEDEIDCIAPILEVHTNFWAHVCFILRVRATPALMSFEIYLCGVPTLAGAIPMQFRTIGHIISSLGTGEGASEARQQGPPLDQAIQEAETKSQRYQVLVLKALEAAIVAQTASTLGMGLSSPPPASSNVASPPRRRRKHII